MPALDSEIELCRFHLGYGNLLAGSVPYTDDGFRDLFYHVAQPNISEFEETTVALAVAVGVVAVTPASMTGIVPHARMVTDLGEDAETIVVRSVTATTFTARFAGAHAAEMPIAVQSGLTHLRELLHALDKEYKPLLNGTIMQSAGLKQIGRGAVEWFGAGSVLEVRSRGYRSLVARLSGLLRIEPFFTDGRTTRIEIG